MISFFKPKPYFSKVERERIIEMIRIAETNTSGEVRLFIESRCKSGDPLKRAVELFTQLKMAETAQRNAVILYIAMKDHKVAIYGDEGIHQKVGQDYWDATIAQLIADFKIKLFVEGITKAVSDIGHKLKAHFPYKSSDKNELPDDIVFGR